MAYAVKKCKVCGKSYEACHTPNPTGMFRWFDVACSRECARIYFERVEAAREVSAKEENTVCNMNDQAMPEEVIEEQPVCSCCSDFNGGDTTNDIVTDEMSEV